jgi:AcrR family transcriptional regulator
MSAATNSAFPPAERMSATTASPRFLSRPLTTTKAPSAASAEAIATPRPPVEPVTHGFTGTLSKMDLQVQKLTAKGQATRQRIIEGAAAEVRERGVADTTLDDIRSRTQTSKSQLFHYFPDGKEQLLLAVAEHEARMVLDDQQPYLGGLTSWAAWQSWRDAVVERYRRQGQHCPLAVLMSEIGRNTPGAQAVTSALMDKWHKEIAAGVRHMQEQAKVPARLDADRISAALLAGIQGGVGIMLATGDLSYLEAALDAGIESLRHPHQSSR